jgi:hypothetical protein
VILATHKPHPGNILKTCVVKEVKQATPGGSVRLPPDRASFVLQAAKGSFVKPPLEPTRRKGAGKNETMRLQNSKKIHSNSNHEW